MREYLSGFFKEFEYDGIAAGYFLDLYDKIEKNPKTRALLSDAINMYNETINCDYTQIILIADEIALKLYAYEFSIELLVFICLSKHLREVYKERNVDDEIYKNTILDLKYKMWECQAVKGIIGTFVARWFSGFFNMTRFALGRLQFEIQTFNHEFEQNGHKLTPESKVINIHIPRTLTPIDAKSLDESFMKAKDFFKEETGETAGFVCHSWLLYPENKKILNPKSNTYRFMERFTIIDYKIDKNAGDLWRIFDTDEKRPEMLPDDTAMRKAYVKHLKNGGKTGWGFGVFFL